MVRREQVEELMKDCFPSCPLCSSKGEWDVSGMFKTYVQCISCGAKWMSNDFIKCEELKELMLMEIGGDGSGSSLLRKNYPVTFWQNLDAKKLTEEDALVGSEQLNLSKETADDFIENSIEKHISKFKDFSKLAHSALPSLAAVLGGGATTFESQRLMCLLSIMELNEIIVLQNELILRALRKVN